MPITIYLEHIWLHFIINLFIWLFLCCLWIVAVIRTGTFAKYDYGLWGNLKRYGHIHPPAFDLQDIPESLPLWMAYGGNDALADVTDVRRTIKELKSKPRLLYLEPYGHIDFVMSVKANDDVYHSMIKFLRSIGGSSSNWSYEHLCTVCYPEASIYCSVLEWFLRLWVSIASLMLCI